MNRLEIYNNGSLPTAGIATEYTWCENALSYKPADVSGLSSMFSGLSQSLTQDFAEQVKNTKANLVSLDDEWGTKFISINNESLNIVRQTNYEEQLSKIDAYITEAVEKCNQLVEVITSKTEEINEYLNKLEINCQKKKELDDVIARNNQQIDNFNTLIQVEQAKEQPNASVIAEYQVQKDSVASELSRNEEERNKYDENKLDEPDGQWVVG